MLGLSLPGCRHRLGRAPGSSIAEGLLFLLWYYSNTFALEVQAHRYLKILATLLTKARRYGIIYMKLVCYPLLIVGDPQRFQPLNRNQRLFLFPAHHLGFDRIFVNALALSTI